MTASLDIGRLDDLGTVLRSLPGPVAVAVSGGIDSLTLATVAHDVRPDVRMHHAVSPAVPAEATSRTREIAANRAWRLDLFDAGEFADADYRANPVNRCFFCKTSLYGTIARRIGPDATIVSGTNADDLGEYRPGLDAAREHGVRHPFVEAGIDKGGVRAIARLAGLGSLADLPASPCLSSRIETGIAIDPSLLATVERIEGIVRRTIDPATVRCRIRASGLVIELDAGALAWLDPERETSLRRALGAATDRSPRFVLYRNGSAFLRQRAA